MSQPEHYKFVVIGAGPAGHQAAITAAEAGVRTLLVERGVEVGGECVFRGTIPSKTLLASARALVEMRRNSPVSAPDLAGSPVPHLMGRLSDVRSSYSRSIRNDLEQSGVNTLHARACFTGPNEILCESVDGSSIKVTADYIVLATGTRPRQPPELPLDHERVLDSDSALSLAYLPADMVVVGAGVIACEFASLFQALGVQVTMLDKHPSPMGFLEPELSQGFLDCFERDGGRFIPGVQVESMERGRPDGVHTRLSNGEQLHTAKVLVAMGRVASLGSLNLDVAGLEATSRGLLKVDEFGRTSQAHIYAAGDISGAPALAAASSHQGRMAVRHALGMELGASAEHIPCGIYTMPELASVGLTEAQARERFGDVLVGRADFADLARAQIDGNPKGLLKLICEPQGKRLVGMHCMADRATELIHSGQMALVAGSGPEVFENTIFNFPTYAQAYTTAAHAILEQLRHQSDRHVA